MSLPDKQLFRPDEVADYFRVTVQTIYLWAEHGHLEAVRPGPGKLVRITRESMDRCKFRPDPITPPYLDDTTEEDSPEPKKPVVRRKKKGGRK